MSTIGERIKIIRAIIELSQVDFAKRLGVKPSHISMLESGNANPSNQLINLICRTFEISGDWLRSGEGPVTWVPEATLKEIYETKFNIDGKTEKHISNILDGYASIIDKITEDINMHQLADHIKIDPQSNILKSSKKNLYGALEVLKMSIDSFFIILNAASKKTAHPKKASK